MDASGIQFGLDTPFWRDFMLPRIQNRAKSSMRALATGKSDTDDIQRGWFQALEWVMSMPLAELESLRRDSDDQSRVDRISELDEFRARQGFRSPFASPAPGELTATEEPNG